MALTKRRLHNKKLNRNLKGLLSKCYKYGMLEGVELALYVDYTQKGEFVSYESQGYNCHDHIVDKKKGTKSTNYTHANVMDRLGNTSDEGVGDQKKIDVKAICQQLKGRAVPQLPELNLSIRNKQWSSM